MRTLAAGKRGAAAAFLILLPPLLGLLIAGLGKDADSAQLFQGIVFSFTLWFMLFLLALIFGISLSSGEIEEGTVGYLYLSAVPKWLIVLIQVGVTAAGLTVALFLSLLLTALAANLAGDPLPHLWRDVFSCTLVGGAGILVALGYYVTCGLVCRTPLSALAAAVIPTFFWELLVTWWPIPFAAYTVTNNLRGLLLVLLFEGRRGPQYSYARNFQIPSYAEASLFLSVLAGLFLITAMIAAMNRSIEGKEAR